MRYLFAFLNHLSGSRLVVTWVEGQGWEISTCSDENMMDPYHKYKYKYKYKLQWREHDGPLQHRNLLWTNPCAHSYRPGPSKGNLNSSLFFCNNTLFRSNIKILSTSLSRTSSYSTRLVTPRGRYYSHPLPASFIRINAHNGTFSEEVTSVHKKCHHITITHETTVLTILCCPQDIFPNDGQGTVYEKYISNEPDVVEWVLRDIFAICNVHDEISGNTTTMIPMCLATTKTWTSRKPQTTVRLFNISSQSR